MKLVKDASADWKRRLIWLLGMHRGSRTANERLLRANRSLFGKLKLAVRRWSRTRCGMMELS